MLKNLATLFCLSLVLQFLIVFGASQSASARTKRHTKPVAGQMAGAYFVPPPPPYTPSILPEYGISSMLDAQIQGNATAKVESPYSKYIYTRNPADAPQIVQPNKYITYWKS